MTKTLRVDLADLEGIPHASGASGTSVTVTAEYTSPVILEADGTIILSPKSKTMGASGRVDFDGIYASDSEEVREDHRGFAIRVKVAIREPNGATRTWSRTVKPLEYMAETVRLGRMPSAQGLPPQWVSVDDFVNAVDAQLGAAREAAESAESAAQSASLSASNSATLAAQAQAAALEVPDANVSALIGNPATETRQALAESFAAYDEPGFDIIVLAGQSNMSGRGVPFDVATTDPTDTRVYQYGSTGRILRLAEEPLDMHDTPSGIGPGLGFARWYASRIAVGRRVLLVPTARGGTGFRAGTFRWLTTHTPTENNLYLQAVRQTKEALAAAGPGARVTAILWHQGEFDSITQGGADAYQGRLDALINGFRAEFGTVPFILGQMVPDHLGTNYRTQVDGIHADTPNRHAGAAYARGISGSFIDGDHYGAVGQRFLGRAMFEQYTAMRDDFTVTPPATPTGLTASEIGDTTITLTWDREPGAIGYVLEWRPSGTSEWTRVAVMGTRHTLTGLTQNLTHLIRVQANNSAGPSGFTTTINPTTTGTVPPPPPEYILDEVSGGIGAYSTRRLREAYSGPAIRVRRSSDNTEQDISFTGDDLDTSTLTSFVGAGDGHVVTWYDQSGGTARDVTQATPGAQPRIVIGGTVQTRGGQPVATFDGTDDHLTGASYILASSAGATVALVADITAGQTLSRIYSEANSAAANAQYSPLFPHSSGGTPASLIRDDANDTVLNTSGTGGPDIRGSLKQFVVTDSTTSLGIHVDGSTTGTSAYTRSSFSTVDNLTIGALKRSTTGTYAAMALGEFIVWGSALNSTDRGTVSLDQKTHWSTA